MAFVAAPSFWTLPHPSAKRPRRRPTMELVRRVTRSPNSPAEIPKSIRIALTRERMKNWNLLQNIKTILPHSETLELPCIETVEGEDRNAFPEQLANSSKGWIVLTSPEAASVFVDAWRKAKYPTLGRIATVGRATSEALFAVGLDVSFQPSKANAKTLVKEFPVPLEKNEPLLYPASAKASGEVVDGLTKRGFAVTRLNTYSTETVKFDLETKRFAEGAHIVTFASPSAVRGWIENMGVKEDIPVACIGETSATAAKKAGYRQVHYPDKPGTEGWLHAICEAVRVYADTDLTGVVVYDFSQ